MSSNSEIITLNVGGKLFTTTRMTLTSVPESVLGRMFDVSSPFPPARILDGAYFVDSNPAVFSVILDYLRYKTVIVPPDVPPEAIQEQARYFGLDGLIDEINTKKLACRVRVNAGGTIFETSRETLMKQPKSYLAQLAATSSSDIFVDVCPKAFEIVLNFLRCGARKIPPNTNVCTENIGYTAEVLGINICMESKKGPEYCKISWIDDRRDKSRFCNCKMLGLRNHRNVSSADDWLVNDS
eukprot:TRINITY_DN3474_c0_g1_i4.p1 TRINITY_DN3474_c0_g1~~TRINITY_DN3474_c0_g1_i4.p1  ORF type:complete len:240 (-),score=19.63 TRINITY_DN3474_c0_g1_i4:286-1005(-)